tara:strand:+ start:111 stop:530 length:420 start_codon:yes stop_codon:yes gene_type:complete
MMNPFHLAIQVHDLNQAREFYGSVLGCSEGRSAATWIDFNLYGHQLVCHLNRDMKLQTHSNAVDEHDVPVPHFGVVLNMDDWEELAQRLRDQKVDFIIEPYIRFEDQPGKQGTMFFSDPSGNAIEFKAFRDIENELFAK